MSKEQEDAFIIAGEIARLHGGKLADRLVLAKSISAALLEFKASGFMEGAGTGVDWCIAKSRELRSEAQQLREAGK